MHLIHAELRDELRAAGVNIIAGQMGENVTTRGLDLLALPARSRLRLGDAAVVEVTGLLRSSCFHLDEIQKGMMAACLDRGPNGALVRKAGVMGIVVADGDVRSGDKISVELPPGPHLALEPV